MVHQRNSVLLGFSCKRYWKWSSAPRLQYTLAQQLSERQCHLVNRRSSLQLGIVSIAASGVGVRVSELYGRHLQMRKRRGPRTEPIFGSLLILLFLLLGRRSSEKPLSFEIGSGSYLAGVGQQLAMALGGWDKRFAHISWRMQLGSQT